MSDGFDGYYTIETHCAPFEENSKKNDEWLSNFFSNVEV